MALFTNTTAADLKKGNIIMFTMEFSRPSGPPSRPIFRGSICLRPDVLFDIFDRCRWHKRLLGGVCVLVTRNCFTLDLILSYRRVSYFHPQPCTTMVFPTWQHHGHWRRCIHTVGPRFTYPRALAPYPKLHGWNPLKHLVNDTLCSTRYNSATTCPPWQYLQIHLPGVHEQ